MGDETILYYDARSKKHQITEINVWLKSPLSANFYVHSFCRETY